MSAAGAAALGGQAEGEGDEAEREEEGHDGGEEHVVDRHGGPGTQVTTADAFLGRSSCIS